MYTSSIYPVLPSQYRLKSSSWPGSGSGGSCLSGGGHGGGCLVVVVVVVAPVSQWWWSVSPRVFLAKIPFLAFSRYHGNHFAKFLAHVFKLGQNLSSCQVSEKSIHRFGRNDGTNIQTDRQTEDRQILFFHRHATWHKTISGVVSSIPKSLVKI